jgi:hypothetical protein
MSIDGPNDSEVSWRRLCDYLSIAVRAPGISPDRQLHINLLWLRYL